MNKMGEMKYEKAMMNRYNIETSATIEQVAEASTKAIFNQLGLGEGELWRTTQEQYSELVKLRRELASTKEDLRKAKYKISEMNLKEKEKSLYGEEEDDFDTYYNSGETGEKVKKNIKNELKESVKEEGDN